MYPYNIGPETITVYTPDGVVSGARTRAAIEAIKSQDWETLIALLSPVKMIGGALAAYGDVIVETSRVLFKGREVNNASAERLLQLAAEGLPLDSELKCLASLMRHDDPRVIENFERFIQRWNIPRVADGRIVLCKGVRSDFRDGHTGKVDWSVGNTVTIPWEEADRDPNNTCSRGLHAAPLEGARGYAARDGHLLELYVWPEHIAALPYDYEQNGKVRVVQAFVARTIPRETAEQYYAFAPLVYDDVQDDSALSDATREHMAKLGYVPLSQSEVDANPSAARASELGVVFYIKDGKFAYGRPANQYETDIANGLFWSSDGGRDLGELARFALENLRR